MDNMKNVLHMDNVTMQFGGVVAVNGLSLDVNEHEIVALIGPDGASCHEACRPGLFPRERKQSRRWAGRCLSHS